MLLLGGITAPDSQNQDATSGSPPPPFVGGQHSPTSVSVAVTANVIQPAWGMGNVTAQWQENGVAEWSAVWLPAGGVPKAVFSPRGAVVSNVVSDSSSGMLSAMVRCNVLRDATLRNADQAVRGAPEGVVTASCDCDATVDCDSHNVAGVHPSSVPPQEPPPFAAGTAECICVCKDDNSADDRAPPSAGCDRPEVAVFRALMAWQGAASSRRRNVVDEDLRACRVPLPLTGPTPGAKGRASPSVTDSTPRPSLSVTRRSPSASGGSSPTLTSWPRRGASTTESEMSPPITSSGGFTGLLVSTPAPPPLNSATTALMTAKLDGGNLTLSGPPPVAATAAVLSGSTQTVLAAASTSQVFAVALLSPMASTTKVTTVGRTVGLAFRCSSGQVDSAQLGLAFEQFIYRGPDGSEGPAWVALVTTMAVPVVSLALSVCLGRLTSADGGSHLPPVAPPDPSPTQPHQTLRLPRFCRKVQLAARSLFTATLLYYSPNVTALAVRVTCGGGTWGHPLIGVAIGLVPVIALVSLSAVVLSPVQYVAASVHDRATLLFSHALFLEGCRLPDEPRTAATLRREYTIADIGFALLAAAVSAVPFGSRTSCLAGAWALVVLAAAQCAYFITVRPYFERRDTVCGVAVLLTNVVVALMSAITAGALPEERDARQHQLDSVVLFATAVYFGDIALSAAVAVYRSISGVASRTPTPKEDAGAHTPSTSGHIDAATPLLHFDATSVEDQSVSDSDHKDDVCALAVPVAFGPTKASNPLLL